MNRGVSSLSHNYNACIKYANKNNKPRGDVDIDTGDLIEREAWDVYDDR